MNFDEAKRVIDRIRHNASLGFVELRAFPDKKDVESFGRKTFPIPVDATPADIDLALDWCAAKNNDGCGIFIGWNPRVTGAGTKDDIGEVANCYVDLDWHKTNHTLEETLEFVRNAPHKPSLVVCSGNGLQLIFPIATSNKKSLWQKAQEGLFDYFKEYGADRAVVTDESRVLRLPGFNHLKGEPKLVHILPEFTDSEHIPTELDLGIHYPAPEVPEFESKLPDEIEEGGSAEYQGRNGVLFKEACALRGRGYSEAEILPLILKVNDTRCVPPLTRREVEELVRGVCKRYARGGGLDSLVASENIADLAEPVGRFRLKALPSVAPILYGLHPGEIGVLQAVPNAGKTTLMLNVAMSAACGREFLPMYEGGTPRKVLYIDGENRASFLQMDVVRMMEANFDDFDQQLIDENLFISVDKIIGDEPLNLSNPGHIAAVERKAIEIQAEIIVIDTLNGCFTMNNENDNGEMTRSVIKPLQKIGNLTGACVVVVHHIGKAKSEGGSESLALYRGRGASSLPAYARSVFNIEAMRDPEGKRIKGHISLECAKIKGQPFENVNFALDFEKRWYAVMEPAEGEPQPDDSAFDQVLGFFQPNTQLTKKDIEMCFGAAVGREVTRDSADEARIKRIMSFAERTGFVKKVGRGKWEGTPLLFGRLQGKMVGVRESVSNLPVETDEAEEGEFVEL